MYTNTAYPSHSSADLLTVTYYDRYDFLNVSGEWTPAPQYDYFDEGLEGDSYGHSYAQPTTEHTAVKGQVTGSKTRNLKTGEWIGTISYYDDKYRVIQTLSDNARGGYDRVTNLYDFVGQVLQTKVVHYATDTTDVPQEILRRFEYDHAGRLLATYHQIDDQPEVLLSANGYNELSQLTAKGLHAGAETVAYDYNIRGWLTAISSPLFSQELFYNAPSGLDGQMARYNGNISAMKWGDHLSGNPMGYVFGYDKLNRLTEANHFEGMTATNKYKEWLDYDLNGNILTLQRSGNSSALIDDLAFDYGTMGNRLMSVTDAEADTTTFHDRNTSGADYFYDKNGSMVTDLNKEIDSIYYNHLNLTDKVVFATGDSILYFYDAAGIKLRQEMYKAGILKMKRDYAGEFYYENDTLKFIHHEEGRVVIQNEELSYEYHLRDHLGNNRVTFSTVNESYTIVATMEDANATNEEAYFENVSETRVSMAAANNTPEGNKAARVQSTDPIGPMTMLSVNKGDTVTLSAYAYYEGDGSTDGLISESVLLAALLSSYSGASGISEVSSQTQAAIENGLDFPNNLIPKTNETNDDAPKAYINYMLFDREMTFVTSGFKQISTAAQFQKELVQMEPIVIAIEGYVLAYVSNESDELNYVHFDDFSIYHAKTNVVSADSYYAYGGTYSSFIRTASVPQKFKFIGKEWQEETGLFDIEWRQYDPWVPHFTTIDPLAEAAPNWTPYRYGFNNPMRFTDPTGMLETASNGPCGSKPCPEENMQKTDPNIELEQNPQGGSPPPKQLINSPNGPCDCKGDVGKWLAWMGFPLDSEVNGSGDNQKSGAPIEGDQAGSDPTKSTAENMTGPIPLPYLGVAGKLGSKESIGKSLAEGGSKINELISENGGGTNSNPSNSSSNVSQSNDVRPSPVVIDTLNKRPVGGPSIVRPGVSGQQMRGVLLFDDRTTKPIQYFKRFEKN